MIETEISVVIPGMKNKHKTVQVKYKDMIAEIDEEIAPLILEIWKADINTDNSCQANPDEDWICP